MTDTQPTIWGQLWAAAPQISAVVAGLTVVIGIMAWMFGGVRPQSQIDLDNLKVLSAKLEAQQQVIVSRLDALPRASDFADWTAHLARLDAVFDGQREKITQSIYDIKDLNSRYQTMNNANAAAGRK